MSFESASSNSEIPLLTFNSLYNILREEKKNKSLQELPEKFYQSVSEYIKSKKQEIKKLMSDESKKDKLNREKITYNNSRKIINEIFSIRATKISEIAIKNKIYGDEFLATDNILNEEKEFFEEVISSTRKLQKVTEK